MEASKLWKVHKAGTALWLADVVIVISKDGTILKVQMEVNDRCEITPCDETTELLNEDRTAIHRSPALAPADESTSDKEVNV